MKRTGEVAHAKAQRRKGELRGRENAASSIAHSAWHAKAQRRKGELRGRENVASSIAHSAWHAKVQRRKGELWGRVNAASSIAHSAWHAKAQRRKGELWGLAVAGFTAAALFLLLMGSAAAQGDAPVLHPGEVATGAITSSSSDAWRVTVCAGDVATVTLTSADFTPYLEVTDVAEEIVASSAAEDETGARVVLTATATTSYTLFAGPDRRSARGDYALALVTAHLDAAQRDLLAPDGFVAAGAAVAGSVTRQAGESWLLYACAGEPVTLTVAGAFAPYLEVLAGDGETVLAEAEGNATAGAALRGFAPETTGPLLLVVSGVTSRDRGAYTLTVAAASASPAGAGPSVTPTRRAVVTATPSATPTATPLACTVQTNGLNMRSGPGVVYDPPLRALNAGTPLRAVARTAAADWLQVTVQPAGSPGWVAARFVNCIGDIQRLPIGQTPPTPQPTATSNRPTATTTPTRPAVVILPAPPTPTPPALVVIPGGGPSGDGWNAQITTGAGLASTVDGVAVFRRGMYIRLDIYSTPGNRRVQQVRFFISDDNTGEVDVHTQTEAVAAYCSFGGNEVCEVLRLDGSARWPSTGIPIRNHSYSVNMEVTLADGSVNNWFAQIRVDSPDLVESGGQQPIYAEITETGPGSNSDFVEGALAFRVDAHDPAVGTNGGDGIDFVNMWVYGPDGREVRFRREGTSGYCIFQNGEPTCNVWVFAEHDNRWPEGAQFRPGLHTLRAEVHADDGRVVVLERVIELY